MSNSTRRDFLISSAAIGGAAALASCQTSSTRAARRPGDRLRIGVIGCGGKGLSDMRACAKEHDIVALCDVDDGKSKTAREEHPDATYYHDYREMLDKEQLDAVTVSTPDHSHAGPALMAMSKGIHVFVQKPLTHTVAEARLLRDAALNKQLRTEGRAWVEARYSWQAVYKQVDRVYARLLNGT